jgi:3-oxoacyl-[acyl-carrier protein] reductase
MQVKSSDEELSALLTTNVLGTMYMCRAVLRSMLRAKPKPFKPSSSTLSSSSASAVYGGRIITLGSVVGSTGNSGQCAYSASKSALVGFTKSLSREVGSRAITVNAVLPGFIESPMTHAVFPPDPSPSSASTDAATPLSKRRQLLQRIPSGRFGTPEVPSYAPLPRSSVLTILCLQMQDVANAVVFLASPSAQYITGQMLGVDGGLTI